MIFSYFKELTIKPMIILEGFILATILCGFLGIMLKRNLVMKIMGMDVMSSGVIAYYVFIASRKGFFTPILTAKDNVDYADQCLKRSF